MSIIDNSDEYYIQQALVEARYARDEQEVPVGAVVVCHDRIVARAHNRTECLHDVTAHAEMQAITAAADALGGKYLADCTLYVTLEPCPMCAGALAWSQIGRVVYGASDPKRGFERFGRAMLHPKTEVVGGLLADTCSQLLLDFFESHRLGSKPKELS